MRGSHWLLGLVWLVVGRPGRAVGADPDPEAVRRLMEQYEREAAEEAAKKAPAPKPRSKLEPAPKPQSKPAPAVDHDREAWKAAEKCGTAACFRAYLADYPKGQYARMARARLESEPTPAPTVETSRPVPAIPPRVPAKCFFQQPRFGEGFKFDPSDCER